jgi:glycosyltransferase involved in cell wall biosynthesis
MLPLRIPSNACPQEEKLATLRIAIVTNRLPIPPIGGIPRYLHGLAHGLRAAGSDVEFVIQNLDGSLEATSGEGSQTSLERTLWPYSAGSRWEEVKDVIYARDDAWRATDNGSFVSQGIYDWPSARIRTLLNTYDFVVLAGSVLALLRRQEVMEALSDTRGRVLHVMLFPLAEVNYYFGERGIREAAQHICRIREVAFASIVLSEYSRRDLMRYCPRGAPIVKVPAGIARDLIPALSHPSAQPTCNQAVTVCRRSPFAEHKNIPSLIEAWNAVHKKLPDANLVLVGDHDHEETITLAENGITFARCPNDRQLAEILRASQVFILASSIECFSQALLEARYAGLPQVALRSGAVPELVRHGETGYLVNTLNFETRGRTRQIPDALSLGYYTWRLLADDHLRRQMSEASLKGLTKYEWTSVGRRFIELGTGHQKT